MAGPALRRSRVQVKEVPHNSRANGEQDVHFLRVKPSMEQRPRTEGAFLGGCEELGPERAPLGADKSCSSNRSRQHSL